MTRQAAAALSSQINMIGEGTVFEGTMTAESDVRISGRVVGKLVVNGKVIVAQEGAVEGEVRSVNLDVAGTVQGEIDVEERIVLKGSARVTGNVKTARLVIEEGALFVGRCRMEDQRMLETQPIIAGNGEDTPVPGSG